MPRQPNERDAPPRGIWTWVLGLAAVALVVYLAADAIDKQPTAYTHSSADEDLRAITSQRPARKLAVGGEENVGEKLLSLADDCLALAETRGLTDGGQLQQRVELVHAYRPELLASDSGAAYTEKVQAATAGITQMLVSLQREDFPALADELKTTATAADRVKATDTPGDTHGEVELFLREAEGLLAEMKAATPEG